ncbi:cell surface protein [Corynebacterium silvaticum]|uniref:Cell surface protein n=1 Tax=Corynebacterium silvaticum TaxID=2320431 RepID=A0A7Y4LHH7_9CORY|nr:cell surface protein [Corynebacterium silvaticum]ARU46860.1 cell surface protein [Corynebacterium silvaticum]MBH5300747.1 cell surface protein [Corynebacterium silvaticum]NOM64946.1 cell surface protein [Corynebacterium silvaticum]NON70173.1 cell surface protein [Corynebacterium silvaticum]TFA91443.1 cell surface protein [Corynebacterium silvaticum]
MVKQNKLVRIRLAVVAAMGIAIVCPSPIAFARPAVSVDSVQAATIDPGRSASLSIEFKNSPAASGTLSGIPVRIARISGIDLTTQEGWLAASKLSVVEALQQPESQSWQAKTDNAGRVRFDALPIGLYKVQPVAGSDRGFEPFIVPLPSSAETGAWNYDLLVHPKPKHKEPSDPTVPWWDSTLPPLPPKTPQPATPTPSTPNPQPDKQEKQKPKGSFLARTGASVLGVALVGLILAALGFGAVMWNKKNNRGDDE